MKIIELLVKLANNEEMPFAIRGRLDKIYIYSDLYKDYQGPDGRLLFANLMQYKDKCLNDEVEILNMSYIDAARQFKKAWDKAFTPVKSCLNGILSNFKEIKEEEDKDIPLIPDDELCIFKGDSTELNYNFKVLKEKINQVVEEFNEYRKGGN